MTNSQKGGNKAIKNYDLPEDHWGNKEKEDWYLGRSHEVLETFDIPLLDDDSVALTLAESGDRLHSLTWAVNGDELHTYKSQKAVYNRIKNLASRTQVENELVKIGDELADGKKLFSNG